MYGAWQSLEALKMNICDEIDMLADQCGVQKKIESESTDYCRELPETRFSRAVDPMVCLVGQYASFLWPLLVVVITANVLMRHLIGKGYIEFEEMQWHVYAVGFMFGLAWVMQMDGHVRIDVVSERFGLRTKYWIELAGLLGVLLPFITVIAWFAVPFIMYSFNINEISEAPGGLGYRWAIKAVLLVGFLLLGLAAMSRLTRVIAALLARRMQQ